MHEANIIKEDKLDNEKEKIDFYRDTPIRYLGYANEIGEAFGPVFKHLVKPSYAIAFTYVLADTQSKVNDVPEHLKNQNSYSIGIDCLLWQSLASVLIPGKIINIASNTSYNFLNNNIKMKEICSPIIRKWAPTTIGLCLIPFIIHPIDNFVDNIFDTYLRKIWFNKDYIKK